MGSRKQQILCQLLYQGLLSLRIIFRAGESGRWWWRLRNRPILRIGWEEANFLHNIHLSILEPEFVENDISFINFAFPVHIDRLGSGMSPQRAKLMVEFYDLVPLPLRTQLTWHPPEEFRSLAERGHS